METGGPAPAAARARADLTGRRILLVEDDDTVAEVATSYLVDAQYRVHRAADGLEGLRLAGSLAPDLIVLDRTLPGIDGIEVCRRIRTTSLTPILMLTALGTEDDRISGLEAGADDYLTKPFSPRELVLRANAILRRSVSADPGDEPVRRAGPFRIDAAARLVEIDGRPLQLTLREYDLLAFLLARPNRVFARAELLEAVWGWTHGDPSTVTVHVRRLREKLEDDPADPRYLRTVWGVGYRLDLPED